MNAGLFGSPRPLPERLGRYEAGLTHLEYAERYPEQLRVVEEIGEIDTTWVVYGTRKRFRGEVIGIPSPDLFGGPTR